MSVECSCKSSHLLKLNHVFYFKKTVRDGDLLYLTSDTL